jgi:hypothetical protein
MTQVQNFPILRAQRGQWIQRPFWIFFIALILRVSIAGILLAHGFSWGEKRTGSDRQVAPSGRRVLWRLSRLVPAHRMAGSGLSSAAGMYLSRVRSRNLRFSRGCDFSEHNLFFLHGSGVAEAGMRAIQPACRIDRRLGLGNLASTLLHSVVALGDLPFGPNSAVRFYGDASP